MCDFIRATDAAFLVVVECAVLVVRSDLITVDGLTTDSVVITLSAVDSIDAALTTPSIVDEIGCCRGGDEVFEETFRTVVDGDTRRMLKMDAIQRKAATAVADIALVDNSLLGTEGCTVVDRAI